MIAKWWAAHNWPVIPRHALPKHGAVIEGEDGEGICAGFIYRTDSAIAWVEFVVSNPKVTLRKRRDALDDLVGCLKQMGKALGHNMFFVSLASRGLMKIYAKHGFVRTDKTMTNMIARG